MPPLATNHSQCLSDCPPARLHDQKVGTRSHFLFHLILHYWVLNPILLPPQKGGNSIHELLALPGDAGRCIELTSDPCFATAVTPFEDS